MSRTKSSYVYSGGVRFPFWLWLTEHSKLVAHAVKILHHPDTKKEDKEAKQTLVVIGLRSRARMYLASRPLSFASSFRGTVAACLRKSPPPRARPTLPAGK